MKGWIEVHCHEKENGLVKRSYQLCNIRWVGADNKGRHSGSLQTMGDNFILSTKESYAELLQLVEEATEPPFRPTMDDLVRRAQRESEAAK